MAATKKPIEAKAKASQIGRIRYLLSAFEDQREQVAKSLDHDGLNPTLAITAGFIKETQKLLNERDTEFEGRVLRDDELKITAKLFNGQEFNLALYLKNYKKYLEALGWDSFLHYCLRAILPIEYAYSELGLKKTRGDFSKVMLSREIFKDQKSIKDAEMTVAFAWNHINNAMRMYISEYYSPHEFIPPHWVSYSEAMHHIGWLQSRLGIDPDGIGKMAISKSKSKSASMRYAKLKCEALRLSGLDEYLSMDPADIARGIYLNLIRFADSYKDEKGRPKPLKKLSPKREIKTISGWIRDYRNPLASLRPTI